MPRETEDRNITQAEASVFSMMLGWRIRDMKELIGDPAFVESVGGWRSPVVESYKTDIRWYTDIQNKMDKIAEPVDGQLL